MKRLGKLLLLLVLVGLVTAGSFVAGMIFYANFYGSGWVVSSETALPLSGGSGPGQPAEMKPDNIPPEFATFWEAWSFLNEQFYGEIPPDNERVYGAIRGMVNSFGDPHTGFIDPIRAAVFSEDITGSFEGIGATIRMDEFGRLIVADPMPGRPAFEAGLRPDDVIIEVDGQSLEGLSLYEAVLLIRGPAGSTVALTIFREGEREPFEVPIVRATIEIEVVEWEFIEPSIGYVRLTQFSKGASGKVAEALGSLFDQGATAIIFDVRSNPGGLLSEAVDVSALFLEEGTVVIEKLKGDEERKFDARGGRHVAVESPLVVLINGGSASASEIVAGAIQDYGRGTLIGEQTFGKGSVQLPHTLSDGSELRVTVAEWLTPFRRQIHGEGIAPDFEVEMTIEDIEQERDPQLDRAVEFLRNEVIAENE
ncbi:MAG: S41 family peptidase [Anaerolineae bacterium]|nr:S41 family peptidase [Anaerolineae bacterium]